MFQLWVIFCEFKWTCFVNLTWNQASSIITVATSSHFGLRVKKCLSWSKHFHVPNRGSSLIPIWWLARFNDPPLHYPYHVFSYADLFLRAISSGGGFHSIYLKVKIDQKLFNLQSKIMKCFCLFVPRTRITLNWTQLIKTAKPNSSKLFSS